MNVNIQVIDNDKHREPIGGGKITGADWYFDDAGDLQVRVSKMSDWRYEMALALHEMAEALICKRNGVTVESVDRFDVEYDKTHENGNEAGDHPSAPYRREHTYATAIERVFTGAVDIDWRAYDDELSRL